MITKVTNFIKNFFSPFTFHASRCQAFTLAEVLITLGIIGVVAAMTIPTLIANYQKEQTVTKLKKVYTTLSQASNLAIAENGPIQNWITPEMEVVGSGADLFAKTFLLPYLSVSKNCGLSTSSDCIEKVTYTTPSKGNYTIAAGYSKFFLNDGTFVNVSTPSVARTVVNVDINGLKAPNISGKDVFVFVFYSGRFAPDGYHVPRANNISDTSWGCNKNGGTGNVCAAVIMQDGWQIKDDYPWN